MKRNVFHITDKEELANRYLRLKLSVPFAADALAGNYVTLEGNAPCYLMSQNKEEIELLLSPSLRDLIQPAQQLAISELQGFPLPLPQKQQFTLVIVEPEGLSACLFYLKKFRADFNGFILIGAEENFPFLPCPSRQLIAGIPAEVIAAVPLLEDWSIPNRLASLKEIPGVFHGQVETLAEIWEARTSIHDIQKISIPRLA
ncbi:MAG: hypothetical protein BGO43_13750 [Gammaproteobacteria bacterium 39-13]|nr:hypothetical protein [Gammaproteobacteria bacterium]OJV88941.1 MAG: hypothetical protein BGO43_13750 [Gammaproteobacteria bacterium 39-13]